MISTTTFAAPKEKMEEVTVSLSSKVRRTSITKDNLYKVEFTTLAAPYYADEVILKCLNESMEKNKAVDFKATAKKLRILECQIKK